MGLATIVAVRRALLCVIACTALALPMHGAFAVNELDLPRREPLDIWVQSGTYHAPDAKSGIATPYINPVGTPGPLLQEYDASRTRKAFEPLAPVVAEFDFANELAAAIEAGIDRSLLAPSISVVVRPFGTYSVPPAVNGVDRFAFVVFPRIWSGHDFTRLFVNVDGRFVDPEDDGLFNQERFMSLNYELQFPEVKMTDKRVENAKRIASLGPKRVVGALRAALPEIVEMMNFEFKLNQKKQPVGRLRNQPKSMGGAKGMRVVSERGDRVWLRERMWGIPTYALYSAPATNRVRYEVRELRGVDTMMRR